MFNKKLIFISLITLLSPMIFYSSVAAQEITDSTTSSSDAPHIFVVECSTCPKGYVSPSEQYSRYYSGTFCVTDADCPPSSDYYYCKEGKVYRHLEDWWCVYSIWPGHGECQGYYYEMLIQDCGADYCEPWRYSCKDGDVYLKRVCHDKGCLRGDCFDYTYTEEEKVQECGAAGCCNGRCKVIIDDAGDLITHFCSAVLNRDPEPDEVDVWESYFNDALDFNIGVHFIVGDIGWQFFSSEEYDSLNPEKQNPSQEEEFIRNCYCVLLRREASDEEVSAWLNGWWSRSEAISIFISSNEFMYLINGLFPGHEGNPGRNFIATMYMGILERLVDGGALEVWDDLFKETSDKRVAAKDMANILFISYEYTSKNPTNRHQVICLYRGLLGRFPNYDEISYWEEELNSGRITLEDLIDIFCDSDEFTQRLDEFFGAPPTGVPDWEYYGSLHSIIDFAA